MGCPFSFLNSSLVTQFQWLLQLQRWLLVFVKVSITRTNDSLERVYFARSMHIHIYILENTAKWVFVYPYLQQKLFNYPECDMVNQFHVIRLMTLEHPRDGHKIKISSGNHLRSHSRVHMVVSVLVTVTYFEYPSKENNFRPHS